MKKEKCSKQNEIKQNLKQGFTLLELLIVVIIIGILAAIALPQYRKVKIKAETREAILSVKALAEAQQRFYLLNSRYADTFSELDLDFSGYPNHGCPGSIAYSLKVYDCYSNEKFSLFIGIDHKSLALYHTGEYTLKGFIHDQNKMYCYLIGSGNGLCGEIFNCSKTYTSGSVNYFTCPNL